MSKLTTYVALLRGINVGGKNMVSMADLKACFEELGYGDVQTYIASGNVIFTASAPECQLESEIEKVLEAQLKLSLRVVVRSLAAIAQTINRLPKHWNHETTRKHDVIFLGHAIDKPALLDDLHPNPDIEDLVYYPGVLFWSVEISAFSHSNVAKIAGSKLRQEMTVRTPGTVLKIYELMQASHE